MRAICRFAISGLALSALGAAPAQSATVISFAHPARYADAKIRGVSVLPDLKAHLERLGAAGLDRRLTLTITILDVDLAGRDASDRGPANIRVMHSVTRPKIHMRYRLSQGRKVIAASDELISDHFYLARPSGARSSSDPLRYEKAMLDDWFRSRFADHMKSQGPR